MTMESLGDTVPIRVLCRVRPLSAVESPPALTVLHEDGVSLSLAERCFTFDKVFGPEASQEEVYIGGVSSIVVDVLSGYNGTIFAYGQTASGKTYTMEGELSYGHPDNQRGITPRILIDIFKHVEKLSSHIEATLKISYFEVYMDKVRDLLDVSKVNLAVREDKDRVPYVKGVTEIEVASVEEALEILNRGKAHRSIAVTNMNEHSSRSHSIFSIQLRQTNNQSEKTLHGKLYLVDLAGSEKVSKSGAEGITLNEAKKINKSLSALGNVISALADGNKNHVPYRDSKLTRILQQSLGGNSRTSIFICCSPCAINEIETRSALMFGQRAKTISNKIQVNEELSAEEWKKRFQKEKEKNSLLRAKLAEYEINCGMAAGDSRNIKAEPSTLATCGTPNTLSAYASMPSLVSNHILPDVCEECLQYQHDISNLCQQLDSKDEELSERSRDILELESKLTSQEKDISTLKENNSILVSEHKDIECKYISAQEELKEILNVLEELSENFQDKTDELTLRSRQNDHDSIHITHLEETLQTTQEELRRVKERVDENRNKTVGMFLGLFNDFSHVTSGDRLKVASDLYKSTPVINSLPDSHSGSHLVSSISDHSPLGRHIDSGFASPSSALSNSLICGSSSLDVSHGARDMSQSMCDRRPRADAHPITSPNYQGSRVFQERVSGLRDRLSTLLESNYNQVVVTPDTNSSYVKNVRLRKEKPLGSGRVFTVFSRAARRHRK